MCGRFHFSRNVADEMIVSILTAMERKYPGRFKTGELFPGDTVPGIIAWNDKIVAIPATFGLLIQILNLISQKYQWEKTRKMAKAASMTSRFGGRFFLSDNMDSDIVDTASRYSGKMLTVKTS